MPEKVVYLVVSDSNGQIQFANSDLIKLLKTDSLEPVFQANVMDLAADDFSRIVLEDVVREMTGGRALSAWYRLKDFEGNSHLFSGIFFPQFATNGKYNGFSCIQTLVTNPVAQRVYWVLSKHLNQKQLINRLAISFVQQGLFL